MPPVSSCSSRGSSTNSALTFAIVVADERCDERRSGSRASMAAFESGRGDHRIRSRFALPPPFRAALVAELGTCATLLSRQSRSGWLMGVASIIGVSVAPGSAHQPSPDAPRLSRGLGDDLGNPLALLVVFVAAGVGFITVWLAVTLSLNLVLYPLRSPDRWSLEALGSVTGRFQRERPTRVLTDAGAASACIFLALPAMSAAQPATTPTQASTPEVASPRSRAPTSARRIPSRSRRSPRAG